MRCGFDECAKEFSPQRHNQKYCSSQCCKDATNKRVREKYLETKIRLSGIHRVCSRLKCETVLSRYTEDDVCSKCLADDERKLRESLVSIFDV